MYANFKAKQTAHTTESARRRLTTHRVDPTASGILLHRHYEFHCPPLGISHYLWSFFQGGSLADMARMLITPLAQDLVHAALEALSPTSSPGINGLTGAIYKAFASFIEELMEKHGQHQSFRIKDLTQGFHQVPLPRESPGYITCKANGMTCRYRVMPMGLRGHPCRTPDVAWILWREHFPPNQKAHGCCKKRHYEIDPICRDTHVRENSLGIGMCNKVKSLTEIDRAI